MAFMASSFPFTRSMISVTLGLFLIGPPLLFRAQQAPQKTFPEDKQKQQDEEKQRAKRKRKPKRQGHERSFPEGQKKPKPKAGTKESGQKKPKPKPGTKESDHKSDGKPRPQPSTPQ